MQTVHNTFPIPVHTVWSKNKEATTLQFSIPRRHLSYVSGIRHFRWLPVRFTVHPFILSVLHSFDPNKTHHANTACISHNSESTGTQFKHRPVTAICTLIKDSPDNTCIPSSLAAAITPHNPTSKSVWRLFSARKTVLGLDQIDPYGAEISLQTNWWGQSRSLVSRNLVWFFWLSFSSARSNCFRE